MPNGCPMAPGSSPDGRHRWEPHTCGQTTASAATGGAGLRVSHGRRPRVPCRLHQGPLRGDWCHHAHLQVGKPRPQLTGLSSQSCQVAEPGLEPRSPCDTEGTLPRKRPWNRHHTPALTLGTIPPGPLGGGQEAPKPREENGLGPSGAYGAKSGDPRAVPGVETRPLTRQQVTRRKPHLCLRAAGEPPAHVCHTHTPAHTGPRALSVSSGSYGHTAVRTHGHPSGDAQPDPQRCAPGSCIRAPRAGRPVTRKPANVCWGPTACEHRAHARDKPRVLPVKCSRRCTLRSPERRLSGIKPLDLLCSL